MVLGFGCRQESTPTAAAASAASPAVPASPLGDLAARIHWLGRKRVSAETNAAGFMRIWNEPESAALEKQTLDRLSPAPWRLLRGETGTNAASALLRPLLDDLVQEESYLEIRRPTSQPGALAFAIRLNDARAALWQTNLAAVLESLTGIRPEAAQGGRPGWSLTKHHAPNHLELTRVGGWTLVGAGQGTNTLLQDFVARVQRDQAPFTRPATNFWLDASIGLPQVSDALSLNWNLPTNLPDLFFTLIGDGEGVRTRGKLIFPFKLPLALEPWDLPTNSLRGVLGSFTAVRGMAPWLATSKAWQDLQIGPPPNQFFVWSGLGIPLQTLFAAAVPNASNQMAELNNVLLTRVNPWLATNDSGILERAENSDGVAWTTVPFMSPYIHSDGNFIVGGSFPNAGPKRFLPDDKLRLLNQTNVVYYDWEVTGPRIQAGLQLGQLVRLVLHRAQLPWPSGSASFLKANTNSLGDSLTIVSQAGPNELTLARQSGIGLTASELHLLADWLESPQFPRGLNTLLGPRLWLRNRKLPQPPPTAPR
jgi:hypothetical protein